MEGSALTYRQDVVCDHRQRRQMWTAYVTGVPGTWVPSVHANCIHNEVEALAKRSLAPPPYPVDRPLSCDVIRVFRRLRGIARAYSGSRWSYLETALSYDGAMRRRYLEAEASLRHDGPLGSSDYMLRAFLKAEKLSSAKDGKPRMIFPRSPRYNLVVASWLKPFEHWLWGYLTANRLFKGSNTRVVAKGLSPRRRANLILRKLGGFSDGVCFEVDGKAFEAHINSAQLREEHGIYGAAYPGSGLLHVLSHQLRMFGVTPHGVRFEREAGRASGDFNTGMGNTLIMLAVTVGVLNTYGVKFDVLADGDNCVIFLESSQIDFVKATFYRDVLEASGHEFVLERPVVYAEDVRFGQSAPVFLGSRLGWTMVREPMKVLSGAFSSHRWLREPKAGRRWCKGVSRCELSLNRGVPVLQAFALSVLKSTADEREPSADWFLDYYVQGAWLAGERDVIPVSREARISFEKAFGISPEDQVALERSFSGRIGFPSTVDSMPPASSWVLARPGLYESWWDGHI
jgi:hypothetical protein